MKFEKFFKSAGIYGKVVNHRGTKWLVCAGVGMRVPEGMSEILSKGADSGKNKMVVDAICDSFDGEPVTLARAYLAKDGRPSDVRRIFADDSGNEIAIRNSDFGLLERSDVLLFWLDVEDDTGEGDETKTMRFLLVENSDNSVIGFIQGLNPAGLF